MKNKLYFVGVILLMFIIFCCDNRIDAPPRIDEDKAPPLFGLQDARAWFETNATDLSPLYFNDSIRTKSPDFPVTDLIPEWDEALWSGHSQVSLIEVPIRTSSLFIITKKVVTAGKLAYTKTFFGCRRLIIARRSNGETEMFLATIVSNDDNGMELVKNNEKFRYLGGSNFSGQVFCSTLEGHFFKAFEYQNGEQHAKFWVKKPSGQPATMQKASQQIDCITYGLQDIVQVKSTTYGFMEGPDPNCVCGGIGCDYCQKSLDEAEVIFCQNCQKNIEECGCCRICKPAPCSCGNCSRCGLSKSDCSCSFCSNCNQYDCVCPICPKCGQKIVYAPNIHLVAEVATMKSHFKNAQYVNRQIVYVVHYVVVPANVVAVIIIPVHVAKVSDALIVEDIQMYRPVQYTVPLVLARLVRYAENEGVKKFMRTAREMPLPIKSLPMTITIY